MATTTDTLTVTGIRVIFSESPMVEDWAGLDEQASTGRYDELLTQVLQADYPQADIEISRRSVFSTETHIDTEPAVETEDTLNWFYAQQDIIKERIQRRYEEVFEAGEWYVEA